MTAPHEDLVVRLEVRVTRTHGKRRPVEHLVEEVEGDIAGLDIRIADTVYDLDVTVESWEVK